MSDSSVAIIGAGLAGCECALSLAGQGIDVTLFEQKPRYHSPAHKSDGLAELVCSNSFRSSEGTSAIGLLKNEMRLLKSHFMAIADQCSVPSGKALAVDRDQFSALFTERVQASPHIRLVRKQVKALDDTELIKSGPGGIVIAAGPLAPESLLCSLNEVIGRKHCYFYDAIAPIVWTDSLDMEKVFRASRYGTENESGSDDGDYLNCPMSREEYQTFYEALRGARLMPAHLSEEEKHFEACMPIEALASRGPKTLAFGPLRPVGLIDPRTGKRPWAVLQLRAENRNGDTCNLVGCQTKMIQSEQARVFRLVPGLENVEFARFGSMHRNTYVNAPLVLDDRLALRRSPGFYMAGQLAGVEGYVESAASALWLGLYLSARIKGQHIAAPPPVTALGALLSHLRQPAKNFQPSNVNFGLMPELGFDVRKKERKEVYATRAGLGFAEWFNNLPAGLV